MLPFFVLKVRRSCLKTWPPPTSWPPRGSAQRKREKVAGSWQIKTRSVNLSHPPHCAVYKFKKWDLNVTWMQQRCPVWCVSGLCDSRLLSAGCLVIPTWRQAGRCYRVPERGEAVSAEKNLKSNWNFSHSDHQSFTLSEILGGSLWSAPQSRACSVSIETVWGWKHGRRRNTSSFSTLPFLCCHSFMSADNSCWMLPVASISFFLLNWTLTLKIKRAATCWVMLCFCVHVCASDMPLFKS